MRILNSFVALLILVLSCFSCRLLAFEGYEHKALGDLALRIATDYTEARKLADEDAYWALSFSQKCDRLAPGLKQFYRSANGEACPGVEPKTPSYGDLVRLVDYLDYPRKIFETSQLAISNSIPQSFADLNQYVLSGNGANYNLNLVKAASANEQHFQVGALQAMISLHREAVSMAQQSELFAALTTNALGDHFLHDFFAPGHMTVNRDNSHDAIALGMHDKANRMGSNFRIDTLKWQRDLLPLMDFVAQNNAQDKGDYTLIMKAPLNFSAYKSAKPVHGKVLEPEAAMALAIEKLGFAPEKIHLYGDDLLHEHPDQALFMALVGARGLLDVLDRCDGMCARNSLNEYIWNEYDDRKPELPPLAGIPYGSYGMEVELLSRSSNLFILSVGGEAPVSEFGSSRLAVTAEIAPLSIIGASDFLRKHTINRPIRDCDVFSLCNIAPTLGVTLISDDKFDAWGPSVRLIKAFPRIDLQISTYYQYLQYNLDNRTRKSSYGLRLDTGFSLYSAYVGIGNAYFVDEDAQLQSDYVVSFGMAFGVPFSRLGLPW